jgi:hypothetical protein
MFGIGNSRAIAMIPNGEWMLSEMEDLLLDLQNMDPNAMDKLDIRMMKTPVLSSIIELCPSINDDATLSKVVAAVDRGESSYEGVTQADFERIKEARNIVETIDYGFQIAKTTKQREAAMTFLAFLGSEEGLSVAANSASVHLMLDYQMTQETLDKYDTLRKSCIVDFAGVASMPKEVFTDAFHKYGYATAFGSYPVQQMVSRLHNKMVRAEELIEEVIATFPVKNNTQTIV